MAISKKDYDALCETALALDRGTMLLLANTLTETLGFYPCIEISTDDVRETVSDRLEEPENAGLAVTDEDIKDAAREVSEGDWSDASCEARHEAADLAIEKARRQKVA